MVDVLVIAADESRERYRFVHEPLKLVKNARVTVFRPKRNILFFFTASISHAVRNRNIDFVVILGGNLKGLFWLLLSRLVTRSHCAMRLGGDALRIKERGIQNAPSGYNLDHVKLELNYFFTKIIMDHIDSLIVVTDFLGFQIKKRLKRPIPIYVIPQPVLIESDAVARIVVGREAFHILTVTNLSYKEKYAGVQKLIGYLKSGCDEQAFPYKIIYNILGGGAYYASLRALLDACLLPEDNLIINACGHVGETDSFYKNADLFMYCSTLDALPNVLLEAQIYGLPLLVNSYEAFFDFLEENQNALFFQENDAGDFHDKLLHLMEDETLRKNLGLSNAQNVKRRFSVGAVANQWRAFLRNDKGTGEGSEGSCTRTG